MTTSLKQALEQFIDETRIGLYGTATARAAQTITDAPNLANTNWTSSRLKAWWIQVPADTAGNNVRPATTLTTAGVLSQGGTAWTTTADTPYYRLTSKDWHPTRDLIPLANRALKLAWEWWRSPLTMVPDGDMQAATTASWTDVGTTSSKITTRTWGSGVRALRTLNSVASGNTRSTLFETPPGRAFRLTVKAYAVVGTPFVQVLDPGGSVIATVTASPATTGTWIELQCVGTFPFTANGGNAKVIVGGVESNADIDWADAQLIPELTTRLALPSWVTEWRTVSGEEALRIYRARNRLGTVGSWPARAYDVELIDPDEYQIIQSPSSLNPIEIEFARSTFLTGFPLFVEARRPYSTFGSVSADADVSGIDLDHWVKAMKYLSAKERNNAAQLPVWQAEYYEWEKRKASKLETQPFDGRGMAYTVMP